MMRREEGRMVVRQGRSRRVSELAVSAGEDSAGRGTCAKGKAGLMSGERVVIVELRASCSFWSSSTPEVSGMC